MNVILAIMLAASPPAVADTTPPGPRTLQQDFDDASTDAAVGNCQSAIAKFEALKRSNKVKSGSLPAAAIAVREGICAIRLESVDTDEAAIQAGLAVLDKAGSSFDIDIADGWTALGDAAFRRYDYAGAANAYKIALARQKGESRLPALAKLAKATAFDGNTESLTAADEAIKIISATPKPSKDALAAYHTLHARALLNQGNAEEAYKELKTALSLSGGLTNRTTLSEVSLRGDLAMAAMLVNKKDDARLYLAYTGAGRIQKSSFNRAVLMNPPLCGEETGLRPEDFAVVEFSITDNGTVSSAQTVYSRGGPAVAATFGRAVSEWYWKPEDIGAIPAFYRVLTRVELRCSNVLDSGPGVMGPLRERFLSWATPLLPLAATADIGDTRLREILHHYVDGSAKSQDDAVRMAALGWLAYADPVSAQKRVAMADDALTLASKISVPQEVVNWLRIIRLKASTEGKRHANSEDLKAALALADDPAGEGRRQHRALDSDRLPLHHPLRQLAWLDLAGKAAADGNRAAAQDDFKRTGLTDEQCALLGESPTLKRSNVGSNDYPTEALMMGFEGWVQTEYDIRTDGKTTSVRPIIAYPPLIFVDAATGMAKGLQYDVSFRPGSSLACSANRQTFNFNIPSNH